MRTPTDKTRFLCDEMLQGLARWLRAAGYDTEVCKTGMPDRSVLQQAVNDNRLLITRDHKLMEFRCAENTVIWLDCNDTESCVKALSGKIRINWLFNPFCRCIQCNTPLVEADADKITQVPVESRKLAQPLMYCPACDKVYWEGSHVERMRDRLSKWANS
ncbi:DUF5615 family PIN-like protein [Kaarinaea lacus]